MGDDEQLYSDVAQFFVKCLFANDTQPCDVANGYGVHHCDVSSQSYKTLCDVISCNPGFFKGCIFTNKFDMQKIIYVVLVQKEPSNQIEEQGNAKNAQMRLLITPST